jgi:hypothetical protein
MIDPVPQDMGGEAGIPSRRRAYLVADQGQGVHVEHPTAERHGPPAPGRLRLRRRCDGIPAQLVTHHVQARFWGHPGAEARRRHLRLIVSLGTTRRGHDRAAEQRFRLAMVGREGPLVPLMKGTRRARLVDREARDP